MVMNEERTRSAGSDDLRPEIAVSWWRSQLSGVSPELPVENVPSAGFVDADERLRRSLQPVLDELAANLAGTNSAIVLADHRPVIIDRRGTTRAIDAEMDRLCILPGYAFGEGNVGTNAVGTAAEERRLVRVASVEHYAEIFKHLSCYGVPLIHPLTRRLVGVLDLTFPPAEEHPLMPFYMREAGRRIEGILAEWASRRERAQFDCFLKLGRRGRRAVLSTMEEAVLLNRRARELDPVDQAILLQAATEFGAAEHGAVRSLTLTGREEPVEVRIHTESDGARFAGVVLEVVASPPRRSTATASPRILPGVVGKSPAWAHLCGQAVEATSAEVPILIAGEAGTGKLAVAQGIHARTGRSRLAVCDVASVLSDGHEPWLRGLREALDDPDCTVVVRHLEGCDPAVGAAISADLDRRAVKGRLLATLTSGGDEAALQPLLDRFCIRLDVPPLRDRDRDVDVLVPFFLDRHAPGRPLRFHPETLAVLRSTEFPGNVRGLERLVAGLAATRRAGDILPGDVPHLRQAGPAHLSPMERAEREAIVKALREVNGNKAAAAVRLGISRPTLYRKLVTYGIEPK
jgi:transcriptional regulator of acetoin/glycerol metabolism